MSLIYADSFDGYTSAEIPNYWIDDQAGFGASTIVATPVHYGTQAMKPNINGVQIAVASSSFTIGFALYPTSYNVDIINLKNIGTSGTTTTTTTRLQLNLQVDGVLKLRRASAPVVDLTTVNPKFALTPNLRYYYIEFTTGVGSAVLNEVRIDGNLAYSGTLNTIGTVTNTGAIYIELIGRNSFFDDFYITSLDGNPPSGAIGEVGIAALFPTSDGSFTEWTPLSGTSHYVEVNEKPADGDTTYNASGTSGQRDTYKTSTSVVNNTDAVPGAELFQLARTDGTGISQFEPFIVTGTTTNAGATISATGTYVPPSKIVYSTNPLTTATWTGSDINQTEWGIVSV